MKVIFHIGAHCSDQDVLVKSLLKNRDMLSRLGVSVPGPGRYRKVLGEVMVHLRGTAASPETQEMLFDTVLDDETAGRVVLSNESFISMPARAVEDGQLYPRIGKSAWLRHLFPGAECEFALTVQNIATFLPALYESLGDQVTLADFLEGLQPIDLCWVDVVEGLRQANPDAPILVWSHEESPLLWPCIIRALCGLDPDTKIEGENDLARRVMSNDGNRLLRAYLNEQPPKTEAERQAIVGDFLAGHALAEVVEQEITLPGWTDELTEALTEAYEEDLARIAEIPGVRLLTVQPA